MINEATFNRLTQHAMSRNVYRVLATVLHSTDVRRHRWQPDRTFDAIYRDCPPSTKYLIVKDRKRAIRVIDMDAVDLATLVPGTSSPPLPPTINHRFTTVDQAIAFAVINL